MLIGEGVWGKIYDVSRVGIEVALAIIVVLQRYRAARGIVIARGCQIKSIGGSS